MKYLFDIERAVTSVMTITVEADGYSKAKEIAMDTARESAFPPANTEMRVLNAEQVPEHGHE